MKMWVGVEMIIIPSIIIPPLQPRPSCDKSLVRQSKAQRELLGYLFGDQLSHYGSAAHHRTQKHACNWVSGIISFSQQGRFWSVTIVFCSTCLQIHPRISSHRVGNKHATCKSPAASDNVTQFVVYLAERISKSKGNFALFGSLSAMILLKNKFQVKIF